MKKHTTEYRLHCCRDVREIASKTLHAVLSSVLQSFDPISEAFLRDAWLAELRQHESLLPDGWYTPPPHGMCVLFGTSSDDRLEYDSLRLEEKWPRDDMYLDREEGILYAFASPIHRETGVIGDFGITLYFGSDQTLCDLLKETLETNRSIQKDVEVGTPLSAVLETANKHIGHNDCTSTVDSVRDKGSINIGHTIPGIRETWTNDQMKKMDEGQISSVISQARVFVTGSETLQVHPGMAFTIEPRPKSLRHPELPMVSYHTICCVHENGNTELLENFDDLFRLTGMEYMLG